MSQNNSGGGGIAVILFFIVFCYVAYLLFLLALMAAFAAYAVLLFCSLVLTALSLIAAYRGIGWLGIHVNAIHARLFLARGVAGAILAPAFVGFVSWYFGLPVERWLWPHIAFGGYALASTGIYFLDSDGGAAFVEELVEMEAPKYVQIAPPRRQIEYYSVHDNKNREAPEPKPPFRFASWDDEEEMRRR